MKTLFLANIAFYIGDGSKGEFTIQIPMGDASIESQQKALRYVNDNIEQAKGNAWSKGWDTIQPSFYYNFLKTLLDAGQYKEAADYFWGNANIHFNGHTAYMIMADHPNFKGFEKAYYDHPNTGQYTDNP